MVHYVLFMYFPFMSKAGLVNSDQGLYGTQNRVLFKSIDYPVAEDATLYHTNNPCWPHLCPQLLAPVNHDAP